MAALHSRCGHYIFILWFLVLLLSSSSFSSPNLSGRRVDVYHTSTHGVALVRIQNAGWNVLHTARWKYTIPPPQPFSGTTQVNWCQKRTSNLYGAREDFGARFCYLSTFSCCFSPCVCRHCDIYQQCHLVVHFYDYNIWSSASSQLIDSSKATPIAPWRVDLLQHVAGDHQR